MPNLSRIFGYIFPYFEKKWKHRCTLKGKNDLKGRLKDAKAADDTKLDVSRKVQSLD